MSTVPSSLVDVDLFSSCRAGGERVLDEVEQTPIVDREVGGQPALLLPPEDLLEIVIGTKKPVGVVRVGRQPREARVVVRCELWQERIARINRGVPSKLDPIEALRFECGATGSTERAGHSGSGGSSCMSGA
jgi:hypothetical protein